MKKSIIFLATAIVSVAFAANASAQISVGVGYANETVIDKSIAKFEDGESGKAWSKDRLQLNGFYIEAAYNWDFASVAGGSLALQPGVRYYCLSSLTSNSRTNIKEDKNSLKGVSKNRISDHLIDVPVNVKYSYDFIPGTLKGYAFAGPVLSFGIAAKYSDIEKSKVTVDGETKNYSDISKYNAYTGKYFNEYNDEYEDKVVTDKGKDDKYKSYNMFDLKLALGLGITVAEKVDVKCGYNIGLLNRAFNKNSDDAKHAAHSNILYFGVAYNF